METDKKAVELLTEIVTKLDKLDIVVQKLDELEAQQSSMAVEQVRSTNAIISLSSLLEKAIIKLADRQENEST
jgi:hypothetical protein